MPGIRDVAREAGVSTATVSRAFSSPHLINAQTRERVQRAVELLGYQPDRIGTPRPRKAGTVSPANVVSSDARNAVGFQYFGAGPGDSLAHNAFYSPLLHGAQEQAAALGMHLLLHSTHREAFAQEKPRMVEDQVVSGLLLTGTAEPEILSVFARYIPHIIVVDSRDHTGAFECVLSDGFGGVFAAMQYLFELGYRERIAFVAPSVWAPTIQDRVRGYICALFENGITPDPGLVLKPIGNDAERMAQIADYLRSSARPTAMLCENDYIAHLILRVCREVGLRVPEDLSLIGFDDIEYSSHCDPPLTTIRVDKEEMGRIAMQRLYARIHPQKGITPNTTERHELPVTLVVRNSCRRVER